MSREDSLYRITAIDKSKAAGLREHGFHTVSDLRDADRDELVKVEGIGEPLAALIKTWVSNVDTKDEPGAAVPGEETFAEISADASSEIDATVERQLQDEIESLRSEIERAETLSENGDDEEAQAAIANLDAEFESLRETVAEQGFHDLEGELASLEARREDCRTNPTEEDGDHEPESGKKVPQHDENAQEELDDQSEASAPDVDISKLIQLLDSDDAEVRLEAVERLGTLGSEDAETVAPAMDSLRDLRLDSNVAVSEAASQAIRQIEDAQTVD